MLALIIAVLDDIYNIIAVWLNDCGKLFLNCLNAHIEIFTLNVHAFTNYD